MPNVPSWMPSAAAVGAVLLAELAALAALGAVLARRLRRRRDESDRRVAALAARLRLLESRLERLAAPAWESCGAERPARPAANGARDASRAGPRPAGSAPAEAPTLIAVPDLAVEKGTADEEAQRALGQRHAEVWKLADAGLAAEEIARRTGQPAGEVEVVLGLYRQLHPERGAPDHA